MDAHELDAMIGGPDVSAVDAPEPVDAAPIITAGKGGDQTYRLMIPLKVNGRWLRAVTVRLPTQGDIDDWGNGVLVSPREMFCRLTGLDPYVVKALRWPDSEQLHLVFRDIVPEFMMER